MVLLCRLCLKVLKINRVPPALIPQIRTDIISFVKLRGILEIRIGGSQKQHLFVRPADMFHQLVQGGNNSVGRYKLLPRKTPAVPPLAPAVKRIVVAPLEHFGIPEDALVKPLPHAVNDHIRRGKFHICHPHADKLLIPVRKGHALVCVEDIAAKSVRIHSVCVPSVNDLIKIVHFLPLFLSF